MEDTKPNKDGTNQMLSKLLIAVIIFWVGCQFGKTDSSRLYNPRKAKNGIDTIYYVDSMFKVKIQIDTAIELDEDEIR